jgi:hypothetical protein
MDIYRIRESEILLIDFNPLDSSSDCILYTWDKIAQMLPDDIPELRLIDGPLVIQPSPHTYKLPQDAIDLAAGNDIHKLVDLLKIQN